MYSWWSIRACVRIRREQRCLDFWFWCWDLHFSSYVMFGQHNFPYVINKNWSDFQDFDQEVVIRRFQVSPEHLDLLRSVSLTLRLAGLYCSDWLRLWTVTEGEVRSEGEKLSDRSSRTTCSAGFGSRTARFVRTLSCSRSGLGLFETLSPVRTEQTRFWYTLRVKSPEWNVTSFL